ncbi:MAG: putative lipoprotein YerB precursor [Microgenomates bacterium OLB23]|nr:MAG: putative lipoprotein YerB precursor [Microgenomates bacterium OLB23]
MGVMIENHLESRPQSGLSSADTIYEFVAEGGITRFLTIFYCKDARYVGPVRSARVYFIDMIRGYGNNPLYVHVGGANHPGKADALGMISKLKWAGYNDMNQFSVPFPVFARDYERLPGVATEHTMYSSTQKLWKYAAEKRKLTEEDEDGVKWNEDFTPWKFKDGKAAAAPTATKISYDFWQGRADYSVSWAYDSATNTYKRSQNGKPHEDKNNKKQLYAYNVVVASLVESPANDGYPGGHLLYKTLGSGKALIFQNGEVIEGTWKKPKEEDMMRFYDEKGKEIELVRGLTWVSAIPQGNEVAY